MRRRYEETKSDKRSEPGLTEDYSSETSSDREEIVDDTSKDKLPTQPILAKPKMGFKLDLSKCKIDNTQEIGVEISIYVPIIKVEAKVKKKPTAHEINTSEWDSKTSIARDILNYSNKNSEADSTKEYEQLLSSLNEILGIEIAPNTSVVTVRNLITDFVEREKAEKEDYKTQCNELKKILKAEKESHADTTKRLVIANESVSKLLNENKISKAKIEELQSLNIELSGQRSELSKGNNKLLLDFVIDSKDSIDESKYRKDENGRNSLVYCSRL